MLGKKKILLSGLYAILIGLILITGITVTFVAAEVESDPIKENCFWASPTPAITPIPTKITIGNQVILGKTVHGISNGLTAYRVYLSQAGILKSLSIYVEKAVGNLRLGIYDESSGRPRVLKAKTNEFRPFRGWNTYKVTSPVLLKSGSYWICFQASSNSLILRGSEEGGIHFRYTPRSYQALPSIFPFPNGLGTWQYSLYAVLTTPPPTNTPKPTPTPTLTPTPSATPSPTPHRIGIGKMEILGEAKLKLENRLTAYQVRLSETATIKKFSIYIQKASGLIRLGIYDDRSNSPGILRAKTAEFKTVNGWNTKEVISRIQLEPGLYWLCFQSNSNSLVVKGSSQGGSDVYCSRPYQALPQNFPAGNVEGTCQYSFYAILSGNATPVPTETPTPTSTIAPTITPEVTPLPSETPTPLPTVPPTDTPLPTETPTPIPTVPPTDTPLPTETPLPTVAGTEIPAPTHTPMATIQPLEWLKYRQDKENSGYSKGKALMHTAPKLDWNYDLAAWNGYFTVKVTDGGENSFVLPGRQSLNIDYFENNKYLWGLGPPCYDLSGTGALVPVPDDPAVKIGEILIDRPGLEKVVMDNYYQVGDNARARLYHYERGVAQLVWTSETFSTCYGPVVCLADANNDGQLDVIIAMHYRLVVLNGATGATMMNLNYYNGRNYGFLGVANIDGDPYPEFCIISDFAQHLEVIDNNGSSLSLKWITWIESNIFRNNCVTQPGPNAFADVDHDGQIEVICSIYNYNNNPCWSVLVFRALDGSLKYNLSNCYLNGLVDINGDGYQEFFTTVTYDQVIPTYGELRIYRTNPETGPVLLWSYQNARFNTRDLDLLPLSANTMSANGRNTVVHGSAICGTRGDFFISEPGPNENGETCKCYGFDYSGQIRYWFLINGPWASRIDALATTEINEQCSCYNNLFSVRTRGELNEIVTSSVGLVELKQWNRKTPHYAGPPVVTDLEGDRIIEVLTLTGNEEVACLEAPPDNGSFPRVRWLMKGQGMSKDASTKQDGLLAADLDHDGSKKIIFAQETPDGKASLVAVRADGIIKWRHIFQGFDGSAPVWNLGGITYWVAGNFTASDHLDVYVTIRRSKMHSDVGFLLDGRTGGVIWERDGILIPGGNPTQDLRGHGGDRVACADIDQDGLDELVCTYPDRIYIVDGLSGNPTVIKSTANSLFSDWWIAYAVPVLADLNQDSVTDIFYGYCGYLTALLDNNCNVFWQRDYNATGNNGCTHLQGIGDYNGDGNLELGGIYKNTSTGQYEFRFYQGASGANSATFTLPTNMGIPYTDVVTADLDGEGGAEFLFGLGSSLQCLNKNGLYWNLNLGAVPGEIALADPDRDGKLEIAVCTSDGYLRIYK